MKGELSEKQKKYRAYYQANRERELMRHAKKSSARSVLKEVLDCWEKQGIPEDKWGVYEAGCNVIGRMPRTCFKGTEKPLKRRLYD